MHRRRPDDDRPSTPTWPGCRKAENSTPMRPARPQPVEQRNPDEYAGISRCDRPDPAPTHQRRLVQVGKNEGWQVCGVEFGWWAVGAHERLKPSSRRPGRPGLIALLEPYQAARAIRIGADPDPGVKSYHVPEAGS